MYIYISRQLHLRVIKVKLGHSFFFYFGVCTNQEKRVIFTHQKLIGLQCWVYKTCLNRQKQRYTNEVKMKDRECHYYNDHHIFVTDYFVESIIIIVFFPFCLLLLYEIKILL